jgi:SAM-dependent methyltransferase
VSIEAIVRSNLSREASGVLILKDHKQFAYSDGRASEKYLEEVFQTSTDLGSDSAELESRAKDWISEYHLTRKRAQLLSGFSFDKSSRVLEVGCGCGAITRFLGETFKEVVSIEGSIHRARLARARTRDLHNVEIINSPFQKVEFSAKFHVIICVGVFEYSGAFVDADDPYDAVLRYFRDLLTEDGVVLIAIENQFGLKYFSSSREDHVGTMFEGIEGYHSRLANVRTFGSIELNNMLRRYFSLVEFFYPYPDYKIPDCVVGHEMLSSGMAGEIVSMTKSRDYAGDLDPLWDEGLSSLELGRNNMLPFFANSFVVVAGTKSLRRAQFEQLAIMYSGGRISKFSTRTRVVRDSSGMIRVLKELRNGETHTSVEDLTLARSESDWIQGHSLQTQLYAACRNERATLEELFGRCGVWLGYLRSRAVEEGGVLYLDGNLIDSVWSNVYIDGDNCTLVDQEWEWRKPVRLNVVAIRAIYAFLCKSDRLPCTSKAIRERNARSLIRKVGTVIGVKLGSDDFNEFIRLESVYQSLVFGSDRRRQEFALRWYLFDRKLLKWVMSVRTMFVKLSLAVRTRADSILQRVH